MCKSTWIAALAILFAFTSFSSAITPAPKDKEISEYALMNADLSAWHLGVYGMSATRHNSPSEKKDFKRFNLFLGVDACHWLTFYGLVGAAQVRDDSDWSTKEDESAAIFGLGAWANLIQSEVLPLMDTITSWSLSGNVECSFANFESDPWTQFDASLMFSLYNELTRINWIFPETIGLSAGPVLTYVETDGLETDSDNLIGVTVSLDFIYNRKASWSIGADVFDDDSAVYGMASLRF